MATKKQTRKPKEKLQLEKNAKAAREAYEKNHPRRSDWPPFPLPDIYNSDDPYLIKAAIEAIGLIRRNYIPDLGCNGKWLRAATEVAFDVRSAWLYNQLDVKEIPLAVNPRWPDEQDFVRLEQWFITLDAQVAREISGSKVTPAATDTIADKELPPPIMVTGKWRGDSLAKLREIDSDSTRKGITGDKHDLKNMKDWLKRHQSRPDLANELYIDLESKRIKSRMPHRSMFSEK